MPVTPDEWTQLLSAAESADSRDARLAALKAVQTHMGALTDDLATLRKLRRDLAKQLKVDYGRGATTRIASELGVTPQAVNSFLNSAWQQTERHS
jgi:selenocysteine lyase/cysteine desulfurase